MVSGLHVFHKCAGYVLLNCVATKTTLEIDHSQQYLQNCIACYAVQCQGRAAVLCSAMSGQGS